MYRSAPSDRNPISGTSRTNRSIFSVLLLAALSACGDATTSRENDNPERPQVASVVVTPATRTVTAGETVALEASPRDVLGKPLPGRPITWQSSDARVATVSDAGLVTTRAGGVVSIAATTEGKVGTATITVVAPPEEHVPVDRVVLDPAALTLAWNEVAQIGATTYDAEGEVLAGRPLTWLSGDPSVVEVDQNGRLTAKAPGVTSVSAASEGRSGNASITVLPAPVAKVVLARSVLDLEAGESATVAVTLEDPLGRPLSGRLVTWSSSDAARVFVNHEGRIFALGVGSAVVTASSEGQSATMRVAVHPKPASDLVYDRRTSSGGSEIVVLGLATAGAPVKINAGDVSRDPSASPDGTRLVFAVTQPYQNKPGTQHDLFVVSRDGMNMVWLTRMDDMETEPAWSPDGRRIAFTRRSAITDKSDIWVIDVDGSGLVNLTSELGAGNDARTPAWSPDGRRIAFAVQSLGMQAGMWMVNADGGTLTKIPMESGADAYPTLVSVRRSHRVPAQRRRGDGDGHHGGFGERW